MLRPFFSPVCGRDLEQGRFAIGTMWQRFGLALGGPLARSTQQRWRCFSSGTFKGLGYR